MTSAGRLCMTLASSEASRPESEGPLSKSWMQSIRILQLKMHTLLLHCGGYQGC